MRTEKTADIIRKAGNNVWKSGGDVWEEKTLSRRSVVDISREQAKIVQHASCYGIHPRDCILSRNEKFLLAINRYAGGIVSIRRDEKDGKLREKAGQAILPQGVSLVLK